MEKIFKKLLQNHLTNQTKYAIIYMSRGQGEVAPGPTWCEGFDSLG